MRIKNVWLNTLLIVGLLTISLSAHTQNPYKLSAGARQTAMAYSTVASTGFWSSFHNQAALASIEKFSVGINQYNRFGLSELSNKTFGIIMPYGKGAFAAVYSYYGYAEYNRHTGGLAYGMNLSPNLSAGVQIDFFSSRASGAYNNTRSLTVEAGLKYTPISGLSIGLHTFNPIPNSIRDSDIPTYISIGAEYIFSEVFLTTLEFEISSEGKNNLCLGMEYEAYGNFFIRGGVLSSPTGFAFGLGYSGKVFLVDIGFITHKTLGLTPSLSLVYKF